MKIRKYAFATGAALAVAAASADPRQLSFQFDEPEGL